MATSPDYLAFILDLCQHDQRVTSRAMMGGTCSTIKAN